MKRTVMLLGGILILLGAACVKEEQGPASGVSGKMVTIRVAVPEEPYTKMNFTEEDGKLHTAWESTDCIRVISGENSEVYTISNIISDHVAEFTGPAVAGTSFDILYPGTYASIDEAVADAASPTQHGNGSTAHLRFRALLEGVDAYEEIAFKESWATAHGGTLRQGAAVKLVAELPSGVSSVTKAGVILNGVNYTVPLSGVDVSASAQKLTAFIMLPWNDIPLASGSNITIYAMDPDKEAYGFQVPISGNKTIMQGKMNSFGGHATAISLTLQDFVAGNGTEENPYLIANARQLNNMHNNGVLVAGEKKYFRLLEDIDASSISNWAPLNTASGFGKAMDFDGDGHCVSGLRSSGATYASFSGVLNGLVHDVTFDGASISHTSKIGVVGGFIGTSGVVGSCTDVHVKNSSVSGSTSWMGGFAAEINTTGTLEGCSVENTTLSSTTSHVGGFAGIVRVQKATLRGCWTKNLTINYTATPSAAQGLGGFVGCTTADAVFDLCHVDAPMTLSVTSAATTSQRVYTGGFIGYIASVRPSFTDCSVNGATVSGTAETGGFVGYNDKSPSYTRCHVIGAAVSGVSHLGGFMGYGLVSGGYEVPSVFTECSVESARVTQNLASGSGSIHTGGFAGYVSQALSFIRCNVEGTAVKADTEGVQNVGGFVGCTAYAGSNYQNCSVDAASSVSAKANSVGGFVGWAYVPDAYKQCSSAASVTVTGKYQGHGGFVGNATGSASFTGCSATGDVTVDYVYAGGFAGRAENASFTDCSYSGGTLYSKANGKSATCGGFLGYAVTGVNINGCYVSGATVNVPAGGRTGGFAGQLGSSSGGGSNVTVSSSYVKNTRVDGADNTGGFVGVQYESTDRCYVSGGTVTAHAAQVGGFGAYVQSCDVTNCYTTANVAGGSYADIGGFAGLIWQATVRYCYSAGSVSGTGSNRGAFVGRCALQNAPGNISHAIGWNSVLPFCANNEASATITDVYAGASGTVSARARSQGWPSAAWNTEDSLPALIPGSTRIKAVFVGDSITWQWARVSRRDAQSTIIDATHGALGNAPLPSYMTLSGSNITTVFHPGFFSGNGYIDKGISGQNTTQMRERFQRDVLDADPCVFVLMGGTNDIAQGTSVDVIFDNISYMASAAKAAGIQVVLCSVTPNNREYGGIGRKAPYIESLNARIKALANATEGYTWCDYWTSLVANDASETAVSTDVGHGLKDAYKLYDDLHPGPAAYTVMEGIVKPIIDGLLAQ